MMRFLLLPLLIMPIVELALLIQAGRAFGVGHTILMVIATALAGAYMLKQQGLQTQLRLRQQMRSGQLPAAELLGGVLIFAGGLLLLTPGFITDALGFSFLIPATRQWWVRWLPRVALNGVGFDLGDRVYDAKAKRDQARADAAGAQTSYSAPSADNASSTSERARQAFEQAGSNSSPKNRQSVTLDGDWNQDA